jgi:hypothetical protein
MDPRQQREAISMKKTEFVSMPTKPARPRKLDPRIEAALKASMRENRALLKDLEAL